jgi:hypothetical protein
MKETDLGEDLQAFHVPIESDCIRVIRTLTPILHKIYLVIKIIFNLDMKTYYQMKQTNIN